MDDIDYEKWAEFMLRLLEKEDIVPKTACDCGCGTGGLTFALKNREIQVVGVDISEEMLFIAAEKSRRLGVKVPFVRQDMASLSLHRPVDAIFSAIDGVNYLLTADQVKAFFEAAYGLLNPGGALVFDVSTKTKLEGMHGNLYFEDYPDLSYFWQNAYDKSSGVLTMDLAFFVKRNDGLYEKFVECQRQRAHTYMEMKSLLAESGFTAVRAYGDKLFAPPRPDEERIFVLAKRN